MMLLLFFSGKKIFLGKHLAAASDCGFSSEALSAFGNWKKLPSLITRDTLANSIASCLLFFLFCSIHLPPFDHFYQKAALICL